MSCSLVQNALTFEVEFELFSLRLPVVELCIAFISRLIEFISSIASTGITTAPMTGPSFFPGVPCRTTHNTCSSSLKFLAARKVTDVSQ